MRVNIYVTDEMKRRMDERPNINWSRVAQDAFLRELNLSPRKKREARKRRMVSAMNEALRCA